MRTPINPVQVQPMELKPGDVLAVTVTCHIQEILEDGTLWVALYRCPLDGETYQGIPQGDRIYFDNPTSLENFLRSLFPVVNWRNDYERGKRRRSK